MLLRSLCVLTSLLLGGCAAQGPAWPRLPESASSTREPTASVPIELAAYFRGLKTTRLVVRGQPRTFLVDTAGGRTAISPQLAASIGCQPQGHDIGYRMTGEAVAFRNCASFTAWAGNWQIRLDPVAVFDVNGLLPDELPRLDGVLALDAFRGQVISLDWAHARLDVLARRDATSTVPRAHDCFRAA